MTDQEQEKQEEPTNEFWVADELIPIINKKLEKIQKQATKLKVSGPKLKVLDVRMHEVKQGKIKVQIPQTLFKIEGDPPKLAGWSFVGTVDNSEQLGMIKTVPGVDDLFPKIEAHVGDQYGKCDHCKTKARRKETVIVQNDKGKIMQVGKSCLKDFLGGKDPKQVVQAMSWFKDLQDYLETLRDHGGGEGGGYEAPHVRASDVLAYGIDVVNAVGFYRSNSTAYEKGGESTAHLVSAALFSQPNEKWDSEHLKAARAVVEAGASKEAKDRAQKILDWFDSVPEDQKKNNAFFHNVHIITKEGTATPKNFGYLMGLLPTYAKVEGTLKAKEKSNDKNEHFGSPGQKFVNVQVKVVTSRDVRGYYGTSQFVVMKDNHGRSFTWFNNGKTDMTVGKDYTIKGTIKKHSEYNGLKQTELTRVSAVEL